MSPVELEARVAALEAEVADLKKMKLSVSEPRPWWEQITGTFADDPAFLEAMRLGRDYRESAPALADVPADAETPRDDPPGSIGEPG